MTPETLRRAHELFGELIQLPEEQQQRVLTRLTDEDEALAFALRELLSADSWVDTLNSLMGADPMALIDEALGGLPEQIAGMKVLSELGRGGMGVVYEAQQEVPKRRVALKTLAPLHDSPLLRARLRAEVEALARVEHPGVPAVYQLLEHEGLPVLSMELVRGQPIDQLAEGRPASARLELLYALTEAIAAAHAQGVVHRDLKPENVLVTEDGQVKVLDFGISALAGETPIRAGTPEWAAPEQLSGDDATPATDVHGLGALGWALMVGEPPPSGGLTARPPGLSAPLFAVLQRALHPDPVFRHPDAHALLADLDALAADQVVSPLRGQPRAHARAFLRRHRLALGLLALALAIPLGFYLSQVAAREVRQLHAREDLALLQGLAERLGPEHPAVTQAFDRFTSDPSNVDTDALHDAWCWSRDLHGDLAAAGMAWVTALHPRRQERSLVDLAKLLAAAERWDALESALGSLPPQALPEARLALAMERWDLDTAARLAPAERGVFLDLLREATRVEIGQLALLTQRGRLAFRAEDRSELVIVQLDSGERATLTFPGALINELQEGPDGALWVQALSGDETEVHRLDPDARTPTLVERHPSRLVRMHLVDLNEDGALERLHFGAAPEVAAYIAAPADAPARPTPSLDLGAIQANVKSVAALGGELLLTARGWSAPGLLRITGYPDQPQVVERIRTFPTDVWLARGRAGPRLLLFGRAAGARPETAAPWLDDLRLVELSPAAPLRVLKVEHPSDQPRSMFIADVDGDGVDEHFLSQEGGPIQGRQEREGGDGPWWRLPGLNLLAVGQADDDPGQELLVATREASEAWILGVEGGAPLPRRGAAPRQAAQPPPAGLDRPMERTWSRLEQLVALGLQVEAAQLFERLGARVDATGTQALLRAHQLYEEPERRARVAAALAARPVPEGALEAVRQTLIDAHDVLSLAQLEHQDAPASLTLRAADRRTAPWRVTAPESIRPAGDRALFELALHGLRGGGLELPLRWDGEFVEVEVELEILELDWATRVILELEGPTETMAVGLGRGGATTWGESHEALTCLPGDARRETLGPFHAGPRRLQLSLHRGAGSLRCELDAVTRTRPLRAAPSAGPLTLRLRVETGRLGAGRLLLRQLRITGAQLAEREGMDLGLAMALGDAKATRSLTESPDPITALAARRLLGQPWLGADLAALRPHLQLLLRSQPEVWVAPLAEALRADFPELLFEPWEHAIVGDDPWALQLGLAPQLQVLTPETDAAKALALLRAEALIVDGRLAEAEQQLAPLRARGVSGAWRLTAIIRREQGDDVRAAEAIERWLASSPAPALALESGLADPRYNELLRALVPLPQEIP